MKTYRPFNLSRTLLALVATFLFSFAAHAHSLWIEPLNSKLIAYFGELEGDPETSPGYLDDLAFPVAFAVVTNSPLALAVTKGTNHFAFTTASLTNVVCAESTFSVMTTAGNPGRRPNFYARWHPPAAGAGTPMLTLDLVPTGKPGEVRVYFKGQPLAGVKAIYRTPDDREQELTADKDGLLRFEPKQSGHYHLSIARHRETLGGFHGGRAYDLTSHNAALTWVQP